MIKYVRLPTSKRQMTRTYAGQFRSAKLYISLLKPVISTVCS